MNQYFLIYKRLFRQSSVYPELSAQPFFMAVRYLFLTSLFLMFLIALPLVFFAKDLPAVLAQVDTELARMYPPGLEIRIDRELSLNSPRPVSLDLPSFTAGTRYNHLIQLDPRPDSVSYHASEAFVLVTKTELIYPDENQQKQVVTPLTSIGSWQLDASGYQAWYAKVHATNQFILRYFPLVFVTVFVSMILVASIVLTLGTLLQLLALVFIVWMVASAMRLPFGYRQLYRMGVYGVVVPWTFTTVLGLFGFQAPLLFTSSYLLWMVYILTQLRPHPVKKR